jgi:hypothetical protein
MPEGYSQVLAYHQKMGNQKYKRSSIRDDLPKATSVKTFEKDVDAAYGNDLKRTRSTTGYGFTSVVYRSKAQSIVALRANSPYLPFIPIYLLFIPTYDMVFNISIFL